MVVKVAVIGTGAVGLYYGYRSRLCVIAYYFTLYLWQADGSWKLHQNMKYISSSEVIIFYANILGFASFLKMEMHYLILNI